MEQVLQHTVKMGGGVAGETGREGEGEEGIGITYK